ncbi:MAG: Sporulation protein YtxC [Thermoanaerobacterales bacterium 50_218]|nr:MAG: Sporulation protein YtxC [Thermoanaerobacterales bacterium 50_218]
MISHIIVGIKTFTREARAWLRDEVESLCEQGLKVDLLEEERPPWSFFLICMHKKRESEEFVCCLAVARAITSLIVDHLDVWYVEKIISENYNYLCASEREQLRTLTLSVMENLRVLKRNRIIEDLYQYLRGNRVLLVDGYVNFRLQEHRAQLRRLIERKNEEICVAKAYDEFISLLRYFVQKQEPEIEEIHLIVTPQGFYCLCNSDGEVFFQEKLRTPFFYSEDGEFGYEDHLLSVLVKLLPRTIVFHVPEGLWESESLRAVRQVFGSRLIRCPGCEKCRYYLVKR